ncbi:hypothetical protein Cylst_6675 (plasmid) [Cylindrospermum stagnale PCC 7417]|uniref:Uncharacterized protein n=1 Tax=Cylindrospermum stagnale PCC 7417 TaxID=56107 RepID=K9X7F7_9NOST|nr:hypothetical protein [Cylindrospermum stagnale]AFZ28433.1 hypothetical protein Cylst_6675 [Cylindrospermum stagnale PCC 7417]
MEVNKVKRLNFSGVYIDAKYVENVENYPIQKRTVVVNTQASDAHLSEAPASIIPSFSSTILNDTIIQKAESLLLLEVVETNNIGKIIFEQNWDLLGNLIDGFPKDVPLWRSPQDEAGIVNLDPYLMTRQSSTHHQKENFSVKVNLWFAPSHTDCAIHNQHDFIETHTQIFGRGRMQKFKAQDYATIYEDQLMSPGFTTFVPFCQVEENSKYLYPWHQYYADTDCIWMAIEYHPLAKA